MKWLFMFAFAYLAAELIYKNFINSNKKNRYLKTPIKNPPIKPIINTTPPIWENPKFGYQNNGQKSQLDKVLSNKFEKQRLFNKTEEEVYKIILNLINTHAKGYYRINGQTSLGEILTCKDRDAYLSINSKRVDMLLVGRDMMPIAAIEVNGTGHYQNNALERDETKRAAIESAGIKYIAIRENEDAKEKLERELLHTLTSHTP